MPHGRPRARRKRACRYLVVCNGEVTEKQYFEYLNSLSSKYSVSIRALKKDPKTLAQIAKDLKRRDKRECSAPEGKSDPFKNVFIVTDVDLYLPASFLEAKRICKQAGISLIISNPCFEVWLIDHIQCCPVTVVEAEAAKNRAKKLGLTHGERNKKIRLEHIDGKSDTAIANANSHMDDYNRALKREHLDSLDFAPWTDMPEVIEALKNTGA